eukprot:m51a1_g3485 hypothetical protein (380) ;mRNA; r:781193-782464
MRTGEVLAAVRRPTLLINEATVRANVKRMSAKCCSAGAVFRPHFKTHQSAAVAEWLRSSGVDRCTVSSADMAAYFARAGWSDILIAVVFTARQLPLIASAAVENLSLLAESPDAVDALAGSGLGAAVWVKVDAGYHRTGVAWDDVDAAEKVLARIREASSATSGRVTIAGLLTHAGNSYKGDRAPQEVFSEALGRMRSLRDALAQRGYPRLALSYGDTPTCGALEDLSGWDELRPGNFVLFDAMQMALGACTESEVACAVLCPVISVHRERGQVVLHGGAIHFNKDTFRLQNGRTAYGLVCLSDEDVGWGHVIPGAYVSALSQEHGIVQFEGPIPSSVVESGLLVVIPAHSCLVVTALRRYVTLSGAVLDTMESMPYVD